MMNQIVRRIFAGVSAAILSVSAISSDTWIGNFMQTLHADSDETILKQGSQDEFDNLEQDTRTDDSGNKIYNTNYGLHTDKTVSKAYSDGRTFDLDLESWYIGEKPVDVGLVLDASGSMAWTTNTLYPLEISSERIVELKAEQEANGGYLTENTVETILNPENTDNTKLGYSDYKYYVYEDRSAVSEFVPLGYWDGGSPLIDDSLIGYYPFNGNLDNEAPNAEADAKGSYIAQVTEGNAFDTAKSAEIVANGVFKNGALDLKATAQNNAILLDVNPTSNKFTIEFDVSVAEVKADWSGDNNSFDETPIMYIGSGSDTSKYYRIVRGSRRPRSSTGSDGAASKFRVYDSTTVQPSTNYEDEGTAIDDGKSLIDVTLFKNANVEYKCKLSFDENNLTFSSENYSPNEKEKGKDKIECTLDNVFNYNENVNLIIGGNPCDGKTNFSDVYVKNVKISDGSGEVIGNYPLSEDLSNSVGSGSASVIKQANGLGFDITALTNVPAEVKYVDDNALNLTQTAKYGAILLDKKPTNSSFTLSFKVRKNGTDVDNQPEANILYMGSMDTNNDYYRIFRGGKNVESNQRGKLRMTDKDESENYVDVSAFSDSTYKTVTIVFDGTTITQYLNGKIDNNSNDLGSAIDTTDLSLLLGGLFDSSYNGADIYIDDFYIFDNALTEKQVNYYFGDGSTNKNCNVSNAAHAVTLDETEIAEIAVSSDKDEDKGNYNRKRLADNPNHEERRGWYYVNSHSNWEDIDTNEDDETCLTSGKQYIGILKELPNENGVKDHDKKGDKFAQHNDTATIPSAYAEGSDDKNSITSGDTHEVNKYKPPTTERSIKFYVDSQNHLRCFAWSGNDSKEDDVRTFCSVVYTNDDGKGGNKSELKYQTLNNALNTFFTELHKKSSFSNVSAVRFSLEALVDEKREEELKKLKMLNWSQLSAETIPIGGIINPRYPTPETANSAGSSNGQYNYVMTGGTYTWTGLRSFYENLKDSDGVSDNGRPKYLIIFTDGRDNLAGDTSKHKYTHKKNASNNLYKDSIGNFAPYEDDEKTKQMELGNDSELAGAWADKLKDAGYTIYCVMLATGSISPNNETTKGEYDKAEEFLKTLAGDKETKTEDKGKYVFISNPLDSEATLENEFREVLDNMSSSLNTYTVQDYIDPRFDLVDKNGNILKLGAGGKITGENLTEPKTVTDEIGFEYIPKDTSYGGGEVNATGDTTATIYYNSEKDMYYLHWTVKSIGGGSKPFTTGKNTEIDQQYLNESSPEQEGMWHSTITIKAKDDFIGGNAILTNGNEAGMNLVYNANSLSEGRELKDLSGTNNSVDRDGDTPLNISPSKGFPKVVTCVRLLNITTKPLNEVIYLGEVVSPTYMLSELEDGYMEGSYYLEYLKRYAYRLYPDGTETPLLELLNQWLKISDSGVKNKTFTIPYIYLPDPQYKDDGTLLEEDGEVVVNNNSGTPDWNQKDIVGFLTYTWKRVNPDTEEPYTGSDDIMLEFVAEDTKQIVYNLELKFTPLHEKKDEFSISLNSNEFIEDEKEEFFNATGDEFTKTEGWTFGTRDDYLKALVNDKSNGATKPDVYEWNLEYKPAAGTPQVEDDRKYGDAEVKGGSLIASTTYTKDVVNAGLALEMIVKGEDLQGSTTVAKNETFTFTATRNYDDELDPVYYKKEGGVSPPVGADTPSDGEKYELTFTVDESIYPKTINDEEYYTIWAKLTTITKKGEAPEKDETLTSLPIGTYTIEKKEIEVKPASSTGGSSESSAVVFNNFNADNNRGNFIHTYFPENVCDVSSYAATDTGDEKYLIWDETKNLDFAKENIAENEKDSNTLKFYFGTKLNEITKGESVKDNPETINDYAKDRLGIIMLSYGSNRLAISKEVTSKNIAVIQEDAVLNNFWNFDITLKFNEEPNDATEYSLKWLDLKTGNELTGDDIPKDSGRNPITKLTFTKDSTDSKVYTAQISVKSNTQVILEQLPNDIENYTVSEVRSKQTKEHDFQDRYRYDIIVDNKISEDQMEATSKGDLTPASSVNFINQFPSPELPSTGGGGIDFTLYCGIMLVVAAGVYFTTLFCKKCRTHDEREE